MGDNAGTYLFFLPSNVKKDASYPRNADHTGFTDTQSP